jgi:hypothetical protein
MTVGDWAPKEWPRVSVGNGTYLIDEFKPDGESCIHMSIIDGHTGEIIAHVETEVAYDDNTVGIRWFPAPDDHCLTVQEIDDGVIHEYHPNLGAAMLRIRQYAGRRLWDNGGKELWLSDVGFWESIGGEL